ncbi:MAG TPA: hypothetical protein VFR97_10605 [Capillimicrobium sp.]|nr:hypothetical protein [Capillimicrobium sp.]
MRTDELDAWLPAPAVRTRHRRVAEASPDALWRAAAGVRLDETRTLGRLVQWRLPGTPAGITFRELLAREPFVVLAAGERWSLSGMCGRIWTLARDYPRLAGPEAFRDWDERGTVRVLFAHWVEPAGDGRAALVSEARVQPVDRRAALALRSLWLVVGGFERLIGAEPLRLAASRATEMAPVDS